MEQNTVKPVYKGHSREPKNVKNYLRLYILTEILPVAKVSSIPLKLTAFIPTTAEKWGDNLTLDFFLGGAFSCIPSLAVIKTVHILFSSWKKQLIRTQCAESTVF
jgi:hypothetical protein